MTVLSKELLEELKKKIQQEKQTIQKRSKELNSQDPFGDPERLNDNAASDREASEEDGHERVQALLAELSEKEAAIDASLKRMADGSYGVCENCGKPIGEGRLRVFPTATRCMDCEKVK